MSYKTVELRRTRKMPYGVIWDIISDSRQLVTPAMSRPLLVVMVSVPLKHKASLLALLSTQFFSRRDNLF